MSYARRIRRARIGRVARARAAMGDAAAVTPTDGSSLSSDLLQQQLAVAQRQLSFLQQQEQRERMQKWIAIAATASIPLFGALWRAVLGRRRSRMSL